MNLKKTHGKGSWYYFLLAFLVPFGGMLMVMLVNGYHPFGTSAMLYSDNYHQYYPFFTAFRRTLRSGGSLLYNWDVGMGVDYLGLIAYYLGSPLNLLSVLVPESQVLNYFCMLVPIKLGFAGLFFSLFLRGVFDRENFSVVLFGGFYALCAWALGYQWNVMWLDTFALLPLVMLGMVRLLREGKFALYTLALALSVISNYYIGFFVCIFVFLSFFGYEICCPRGWKRFFGDLLRIALFSALALGMSAFLTMTAMAALGTTQSSVNKFPTGFRLNIATKNDLMGLLDAMRQVAGNMGGGIEPSFKEGLPNLYCGVGSILLGILFLLSWDIKWRDKLCALLLLLFFNVSFILRQLDYIWHGFHFPNMIPYRFSFLYSFVLLVMAYRAWLVRRKFEPLQVITAGLLTVALLCCCRDTMKTQSVLLFGARRNVHIYCMLLHPVFPDSAAGNLPAQAPGGYPGGGAPGSPEGPPLAQSHQALHLHRDGPGAGRHPDGLRLLFPRHQCDGLPQGHGAVRLYDSLYEGAGGQYPLLPGRGHPLPDPERWRTERLLRHLHLHQLCQCAHHRVYAGPGLRGQEHL